MIGVMLPSFPLFQGQNVAGSMIHYCTSGSRRIISKMSCQGSSASTRLLQAVCLSDGKHNNIGRNSPPKRLAMMPPCPWFWEEKEELGARKAAMEQPITATARATTEERFTWKSNHGDILKQQRKVFEGEGGGGWVYYKTQYEKPSGTTDKNTYTKYTHI